MFCLASRDPASRPLASRGGVQHDLISSILVQDIIEYMVIIIIISSKCIISSSSIIMYD